MDCSASFSKSSLDTTTRFSLRGPISDQKVELPILTTIENINPAGSGESSQFGQIVGVHSIHGSEVAPIPPAFW